MKWLLNVFTASFLLVLLAPLLLIVAVCIILIDHTSPFFLQDRIGLNRSTFTIYKLKTMKGGKVTKFGAILRRTGIDELPQLINIIKGNLNFIGPRPLMVSDIERLGWTTSYYDFRWNIKPGLTGLAQLSPVCHQKVSLFWDRYYVNHHTMGLNLKILLASLSIPVIGKDKMKSFLKSIK